MDPCRTRSETGSHHHMTLSTTLENRETVRNGEALTLCTQEYSVISKAALLACVVWIMDVLTHYLTPFMHVPVERTDLCEAWCSDGRLVSWVTPVLLHNPLYSSFILNTSHTPHSYTHPARHRTLTLLSRLPPTQSLHQLRHPYSNI